MELSRIQFIFNRAASLTFVKKKLMITSLVLAFCGLLVVFFRGLAIHASQWILMSLTYLPFFLCAGVLLSLGIFLVRIYHDEIKQKPLIYNKVLGNSSGLMLGASYFSIPIILSYLLLWILLGIFALLQEIPGFGRFFSVILAFGPFLLNLACLLLCVLNLALLFFVSPIIAFKGLNRVAVSEVLMRRLSGDLFSNLALGTIALLPLVAVAGFLLLAAFLTGSVGYVSEHPLQNVLQWFFIMIPFTILLSPAVVFFFNFAAEAHVLASQQKQEAHDRAG
jgi:hypothetical protein